MKSFINRHNKSILKKHDSQTNKTSTNTTRSCNCRHLEQCPIQGKCLQTSLVYKADSTTTDNNITKSYIGVITNDFKTRYRNQNETELSKYIWKLKNDKRTFVIKWGIVKQIPAGSRKCRLCLEEKLLILKGRNKNILNKCRHVT